VKHVVHWDDVERKTRSAGEISGAWTRLGEAAGTVGVGLRRVGLEAGKRSTAVHVHGAEEEIFFVLAGVGLLYQGGRTHDVRAGDTIVHRPATEAHALIGGPEGLDVLAFGTRVDVEICYLPRAGHAWAGPTVLAAPGMQNLWAKDDAAGPLELPPPSSRPANVVALDAVVAEREERPRTRLTLRELGAAAGSVRKGFNDVAIDPGAEGWPPHCHSAEEEILVILDGDGTLTLGSEEVPVRRGHVIARPPGTGIPHAFRAGASGLRMLAYGTREPNDIAYFPRSNKVYFRGVRLIGRIEKLGYWDGED
jgi:uncharacterized cupin superfamily protein